MEGIYPKGGDQVGQWRRLRRTCGRSDQRCWSGRCCGGKMTMSQLPARRDTTGSHSLLSEAHDAPADSTQSNSAALKAPEYSVGYGRPPIHSRYRPDRSGNPKGRPNGSCNVKTDLTNVYTATIVIHE